MEINTVLVVTIHVGRTMTIAAASFPLPCSQTKKNKSTSDAFTLEKVRPSGSTGLLVVLRGMMPF
jgi:hypothetical protein